MASNMQSTGLAPSKCATKKKHYIAIDIIIMILNGHTLEHQVNVPRFTELFPRCWTMKGLVICVINNTVMSWIVASHLLYAAASSIQWNGQDFPLKYTVEDPIHLH